MKVAFFDIAAQYRALRYEIDAAVRHVLESGRYSNATENAAFEKELGAYLGVREVVAVNSGTDALLLSLKALGIGADDEVIVPSFTFFATAEAVCLAGAQPRFADCANGAFNIDLRSVEDAFSPKVKAVIAVHLYGQPVDLAPIQEFCAARNLHLIEDCAQALGAAYRGRRVGTLGVAGAFSFYPTKNLGACGDGGAICCDDPELAAHLRRLRNHGRTSAFSHSEIGINSRLDEIQAAILRVKLPHLDHWNARRLALAQRYRIGLQNTRCILPPGCNSSTSVFHHFAVIHPQRNALRAFLAEHDVETAIYYPTPCHLQSAFGNGVNALSLPQAERNADHMLALPIYPELSDIAIDHVVSLVRAFEQG
ncbi:DegT/DnrJ/EryC1/StrS family aminotransferase [Pseudolysobacter antarcticus]|uniref:DegT/DnrJ/EryC1/StrS family aminotransferase n=1 Tax=Pseudolysobacter antarcticus TaxID=2511995 RepID=A0A411HID4_9GAMM|nr:DegT/DnrJ/EryC1/StrS family aminotransferase [Pseudolysobacter antarcticus]QBB70241.1 DegT/DnrJ/EryC1/StrS family aminotransferase [Pseudolysobacter antarcticus]